MIEVRNLTKVYGRKKAVDDLSFTIEDGEIFGFLVSEWCGKIYNHEYHYRMSFRNGRDGSD